MNLYRILGRFLGYILSLLFFLLPKRDRVRVAIYNSEGRVLAVKNCFSRQQWTLPGGGVKRGESYEQAARREVFEELGVQISELRYIGRKKLHESRLPFMARIYASELDSDAVELRCNFEIIDYIWLDERDLPDYYRLS